MDYNELLMSYFKTLVVESRTTPSTYTVWPERERIRERKMRFMRHLKRCNPDIYYHFLYGEFGAPLTNIQKDELNTISRNFKG
ncbi:hypothetical protein [Marinomonas phage CPP1m]|uniref:Uncharacterized protein n=2 Tax=Murciavirus CPP1m TaxID=2733327 RepID=A0A1W5S614_9CAUD|nr:hypothetical protein HOR72_gp12 [Marinomonas phage CPP1m]ARB11231.1 hypothetical protein [Marinomonas phage CPP1m]ARB11281.1 hypothetical protein [Marinomonas phage CPG1g]